MFGGSRRPQGVEGDVVAKVVELSDETFGGGCLAGAVEEVGAGEVAVGACWW